MKIKVTQDEKIIQTLTLKAGTYRVGRESSCDLQLQDGKVSRDHCEISYDKDRILVTDHHSQNGTFLGTARLVPEESVSWPADQPLRIGPFTINQEQEEKKSVRPAATPGISLGSWRVACGHGQPSTVILKDEPILIGRGQDCHMILDDSRVSRHQCQLVGRNNQLWVTDLSQRSTTRIGQETVTANSSLPWPEGTLLHLGPFTLVQTREAESIQAYADEGIRAPVESEAEDASLGARMWLAWIRQLPWLPITMVMGGICLMVGISAGLFQVLKKPTATPVALITATNEPTQQILPSDTPIPSATPDATPTVTNLGTGGIMLPSPTPTYVPLPGCTPQSAGWLELPFPYDEENENFGTAEQFRAASQRTAAGGRINSFFDHQFPLYSNEMEVEEVNTSNDTMVLFDGSISLDRTTYPKEEGDFYSGHPGLDFSVFGWQGRNLPIETPILAPADATFAGAGTDTLGNNYVLLLHEREEGNYRTSFLHLEPDEHFQRMLSLEMDSPVRAGERIGTMGNTGNSTGHHLHFEVRMDCNNNGWYELSEAIDPYGFRASIEVPTDPMSALTCGGSQYLWRYTWDPEEEGGGCAQPESRRQLDPTPFQGFVSIGTFIFSTADPSKLTRVPIWLTRADLRKVELGSIKVHRYVIDADTEIGNWVVVPDSKVLTDENDKTYVEVFLNVPGKYTVTGKPRKDIIPPKTTIRISGQQKDSAFVDAITIEFIGEDNSSQGVREIHYSLDCGQNWKVYGDIALHLTSKDLILCASDESDHMGDEWNLDQDEYLILATAVDWSDNWEQPASLYRLKFGQ